MRKYLSQSTSIIHLAGFHITSYELLISENSLNSSSIFPCYKKYLVVVDRKIGVKGKYSDDEQLIAFAIYDTITSFLSHRYPGVMKR